MSYSPSSRIRRNSIFSETKPRRLLKSSIPSVHTPLPTHTQLLILQNKLTSLFDQKTQILMDQIRDNNQTIQMLEYKLKQNQQQLNKRKYIMNEKGLSAELIDQLIEAELNKRLSIVSKKFAEMEDAFVVNMFPSNQQAVLELAPETKNFLGQADFGKLKSEMDNKLNQMLVNLNENKNLIVHKCWQISQQIRINEEVIESMNNGFQNIRSKIFSLESLLKSIQNKGEEFKTIMNGKIQNLKSEINSVTVETLNLQNKYGNKMMQKRQSQRNSHRQVFDQRSRIDTYASRASDRHNLMVDIERQKRVIESRETINRQSRQLITNIKDSRREVLDKDSISEISSISNSVSFLPQLVYIPKVKTHVSKQSSPDSKFLAKTKITATLPLKPVSHTSPFVLQNSDDQFLDLYHESQLELTKQIMSPFQQAEYISQNSPLDNTVSALTVPLLKPQFQSSIQDRVRQTIFRKNIKTPIAAHLDSNNYVKKANGAYLFDFEGDVLKCSPHEFKRLCNIKIFVDK